MEFITDLPSLFESAEAPEELLERVDQTWFEVTEQARQSSRSYLLATHAVVEVVVSGLSRQLNAHGHVVEVEVPVAGKMVELRIAADEPDPPLDIELGLVDDLVARVVSAPLHSRLPAGFAVAAATAEFFGAMTGVQIHLPEPKVVSQARIAQTLPASVLARISESLPQESAAAELAKIKRVLRPKSNDVLARWLGVSRPTVTAWAVAQQHNAGSDKRFRAVSRLAEVLDDQFEPDDVLRYVYDRRVEMLGDRTFAQALEEMGTPELTEAVDELAFALIW